jgi:hypothetical protein
MPKRTLIASEGVGFFEAANWIAYDNFIDPGPNLSEAGVGIGEVENPELYLSLLDQHSEKFDKACDDLHSALREGVVEGTGFIRDGSELGGYSKERVSIPRQFWLRGLFSPKEGVAKSGELEYAGLAFDPKKVGEVWPVSAEEASANAIPRPSRPKSGRKPVHDSIEFLALCAWAAQDGLPEKASDFRRSMEILLSVVWGEDGVPGETWLKGWIGIIYSQQKNYQHASLKLSRRSN